MNLKWKDLDYNAFVYGTKLYSAEAKKFIEQIVNVYKYHSAPEISVQAPYSYLLVKCEIVEADNGEILLNGIDEVYRTWRRKPKVVIDDAKFRTYINSFFARYVDRELKTVKNCNSDMLLQYDCHKRERVDSKLQEVKWTESIPLWQIFLMRDLANGVSKDILYKHFSKERVESFVGTQKNTFIVELRKEYTEKETVLDTEKSAKCEKARIEYDKKRSELADNYNAEIKKIVEEFNLRKEKLYEELHLMETNLSSGD